MTFTLTEKEDYFSFSIKPNFTAYPNAIFFLTYMFLIFKERTKAETLNSKLKQQLADYKVPDVSTHCCNLCQVDTAAVHMMWS